MQQEIDLQPIVHTAAERYWNLRTMLTGRPQWDELDPVTRQEVQNAALPFIVHALPSVFKTFSNRVLASIASGEEMGIDPSTILLSIKAELSEAQ